MRDEAPAPAALSDQERLDRLQLIRTPTIGPITFAGLLQRFGSARKALDALPDLARRAGRKPLPVPSRGDVEAEWRAADRLGARLIASGEPDYPGPLAAIADPPPLIFARGRPALFERSAIAIIGARNASGIGRKFARMLAGDLGAAGVVVVSGLARGIDGAAHEASLSTGTIAVVAGGVDVIYPPEHEELTARIASDGVVLSEAPMGARPTARDFPKRNRLISGLSFGVVVVEAAERSGTLITARFALEQGREVFAVPGSPLDPRCKGANRLLRQGATLVESAEDILTLLAEQRDRSADRRAQAGFEESETGGDADPASVKAALRAALSYTPIHRDDLAREVGAPPGAFAAALLDLVLTGAAEEHSGGRFSLSADD